MIEMPETVTGWKTKSHQFSLHGVVTLAALSAALILCSGCNRGLRYQRAQVETPPAYKETEGWKTAQPQDDALRGKWWEMFNDPQLNALEEKVNVSNQNIASAAASFLAARALVKEARSQLFPTVTTNPAITLQRPSATLSNGGSGGSGSGSGTSSSSSSTGTFTDYSLPFDATWQPDLFGRIRNTVRSAAYGAQASAADLENTRLTVQAEVAADYFQLHGQDALKELLDSTVVAYQQSLDLTRALYDTGIDSEEAVA